MGRENLINQTVSDFFMYLPISSLFQWESPMTQYINDNDSSYYNW